MHRRPLSIAFVFALAAASGSAQEASPVEAAMKRMRDSLRTTMLQLQTAQAENVALKAAQAGLEEKNKKLAAEIDSEKKKSAQLAKQSADDKTAAEKAALDLNSQVIAKNRDLEKLKEVLGQWKDAYGKAVAVARGKESERAKVTSKLMETERKLNDRERRNGELFKLGNEILDRYKNFSLGYAITAREPFTGVARVKLENLVQDYDNKLRDQKYKPSDDEKLPPASDEADSSASSPAQPAKPPAKADKKAAAEVQKPATASAPGKPAASKP